MLNVYWVRNTQTNQWFDFLRLNLNAPYFVNKEGVYIIFYSSPSEARVIRIGSGNLKERLEEHRKNPAILEYSRLGQLKVTWVVADNNPLSHEQLLGVEAYLARIYSPISGDRYPTVTEIPVNPIRR